VAVVISSGRPVRVGSFVRLVAVPPAINKLPRESKRVFRAAIGQRFKVQSIKLSPRLIELDVSRVADAACRRRGTLGLDRARVSRLG
jgi:hypothetical protein